MYKFAGLLIVGVFSSFLLVHSAPNQVDISSSANISGIFRRSPKNEPKSHSTMIHNHLSRKVFERACAASKDTIDEIMNCFTGNKQLIESVDANGASQCYKESFGSEFDHKDLMKHKELICNNREKFEEMTSCIYKKTSEALDQKGLEKLTEALVDIGLCIINALDG